MGLCWKELKYSVEHGRKAEKDKTCLLSSHGLNKLDWLHDKWHKFIIVFFCEAQFDKLFSINLEYSMSFPYLHAAGHFNWVPMPFIIKFSKKEMKFSNNLRVYSCVIVCGQDNINKIHACGKLINRLISIHHIIPIKNSCISHH